MIERAREWAMELSVGIRWIFREKGQDREKTLDS